LISVTENKDSIIFGVRVIPRSSKSEIVGEYDECLKVKLTSPPIDGEANSELVKLLAKVLGVSKSDISIVNGLTSKTKQIKILNITQESFLSIL
jgi:uncharacterized protein